MTVEAISPDAPGLERGGCLGNLAVVDDLPTMTANYLRSNWDEEFEEV